MSGAPAPGRLRDLWSGWRLRWRRRELLWRAILASRNLAALTDRTNLIRDQDILVIAVLRNEAMRLPDFLTHYRALGVAHFLILDNGSDDGSNELLSRQPDVSLWRSEASYRQSRFGMDWANWLLSRHGHGHWCLTVDTDELLIYPGWPDRPLTDLCAELDAEGRLGMGALMLDLFPRGPIGTGPAEGQATLDHLAWFDAGPYATQVQQPRRKRWTQGGTRARAFFADAPRRAPTLNKLPLLRWNRRWTYAVSTHSILPRRLNALYDGPGDPRLSGVLLHTKFLPDAIIRAREDLDRRQHFSDPDGAVAYYHALIGDPVLWHEGALRLTGWRQLADLRLMGRGRWS